MCVRVRVYVSVILCLNLCFFCNPSSSRHRVFINFGGSFVYVCATVRVCGCACVPSRYRSSSPRSYLVNFSYTFVYWYVYDCVTVSFLLLLFIGIERPLFRNFGCTFVYVGARARACVRACV